MSNRNNQSYPHLQTNVYQNPAVTEPILDYEFEEGYVSAYSKKLNDEIVRLRKRRYLSNPLSGSRTMAGVLESMAFDAFEIPKDKEQLVDLLLFSRAKAFGVDKKKEYYHFYNHLAQIYARCLHELSSRYPDDPRLPKLQADHNWLLQNKSQKEDTYFWLKVLGVGLLILFAIFLLVNLP